MSKIKRLTKNESGFSVVEVLLVLVTLAIIGVAGYFVAKHVNGKNSIAPTTKTTAPVSTLKTTTPNAKTVDPYEGWQSYSGHGFSIKYPPSWKMLDVDASRTDLSDVVFGTNTVEAQAGYVPGTSAFDVYAHHKGYKITDGQYVDENTNLVNFVRSLNGLVPESEFENAVLHTRTIGGQEAISYSGQNVYAPWTVKIGSNIYEFHQYDGTDVDKQTQLDYFGKFLDSFKTN